MRRLILPFLMGGVSMGGVAPGYAQEPSQPSPIRIGTFDSRAAATAFYRSESQIQVLQDLWTELEEAKASGNEERVKELEAYGPALQHRMHQQVFSTASVIEIMEKISDVLSKIAQEAGVSIIVSRWELPYKSFNVESVDLTSQIVALFEPSAQTLQIVEDLKSTDPLSIDQVLVPDH